MKTLNECVDEYRKQLQQGDIKEAFRGLVGYMMKLRNEFANKYPDFLVSGSVYPGLMDMTYFSFTPESLRSKKLKIAIVFVHDKIRFEVWLAGVNKKIQSEYRMMFKNSHFSKYRIPENLKGCDSIVAHDLVVKPDFDDLEALTKQIETGVFEFIEDMVSFLEKK